VEYLITYIIFGIVFLIFCAFAGEVPEEHKPPEKKFVVIGIFMAFLLWPIGVFFFFLRNSKADQEKQ
jgi:hypothetical protein